MQEISTKEDVPVDKIDAPELFALRNIKEADVAELAASIGGMQTVLNPLLVRMGKGGRYELVAGHRRLKAAKQLKMATVPCRVQALSDVDAFCAAIAENTYEKQSPIEEARAYKRAIDVFKMDLATVAKKVGKDKSTISNRIRLLGMDKDVVKALDEGVITAGHCEHAFLRLDKPEDQKKLLEEVEEMADYEPMSVKDAEQQAKEMLATRAKEEAWAKWWKDNAAKIKCPKCPGCGRAPDGQHRNIEGIKLKKPELNCGNYVCDTWNPFKTKEENVAAYKKKHPNSTTGPARPPREEVCRKDEAQEHESQYTPTEYFKAMSAWIIEHDLVDQLEYGSNRLELDLKDKSGFPMPSMAVEEPAGKKPFKSEVRIGESNFGGIDNDEVTENRELLWKLEKLMGKREPAKIVRVPMDRLVLQHKTLMKGTILEPESGKYKGKWSILSVHRDFTANVMGALGKQVFLDEDELRALIRAAHPETVKHVKKGE